MKNSSLYLALLFILFSTVACSPILTIDAEDRIVLYEDNSSIENYVGKTICEKKYKDFANTDIEKLMNQLDSRPYEIASGSTYVTITVEDAKTGENKFTTTIDYGSNQPARERLLQLLLESCQK